MLAMLAPWAGRLLWIACPDVVGDHAATMAKWHEWAPIIRAAGHPPAFVLQNGCRSLRDCPQGVPLFVGGDDEYKLGTTAAAIVADARRIGLPVHMGRVNSFKRATYAHSIGCTTIDGSGFSKFPKLIEPMVRRLERLGARPAQGHLFR